MTFRRGDRARIKVPVAAGYPASIVIPAGTEGVIRDWPWLGKPTIAVAAAPGVLVDVRLWRDQLEPVNAHAMA